MQKSRLVLAATLVLAGTAAFGDTGHYSATLAQPVTQKKELVADSNLFRCDGSTCILTSHPENADSVQVCRALRREVGTLTAYIADGKPFDADRLAKCNASH